MMKGLLFTLESFIAVLMVFFIIILLFRNPPVSSDYKIINYKLKAYEGLVTLDKTGELRKYVATNNVTAINESLNSYIPGFLNRVVVIYDDNNSLTEEPSLTYANDSISVSYFLSGDFDDYKPREVRVFIFGSVTSSWLSTTNTAVNTTAAGGEYSSIAIDSNDKVHISNFESGNRKLTYCNNTLGTWNCAEPDTMSNVGKYTSIAIDSNNFVHISHQNFPSAGEGNLRYCNNTLGYWTCATVDTGGWLGWHTSIAIDSNDKVHISHWNGTSGGSHLRYCNNTLGSWTCTNVDGFYGGEFSSIAIDSNNFVHISHYNWVGSGLRYCNNTLGSWTCATVAQYTIGIYSSMAIDSNNKIHISSLNISSPSYLNYCNNTLGYWTCTNIGSSEGHTSIIIDSNNKPHISHYRSYVGYSDEGYINEGYIGYCYTYNFSTWNCQNVSYIGEPSETYDIGYGRNIAIKKGRIATSNSFSSSIHISYPNVPTYDLMYAKISKSYSYGKL